MKFVRLLLSLLLAQLVSYVSLASTTEVETDPDIIRKEVAFSWPIRMYLKDISECTTTNYKKEEVSDCLRKLYRVPIIFTDLFLAEFDEYSFPLTEYELLECVSSVVQKYLQYQDDYDDDLSAYKKEPVKAGGEMLKNASSSSNYDLAALIEETTPSSNQELSFDESEESPISSFFDRALHSIRKNVLEIIIIWASFSLIIVRFFYFGIVRKGNIDGEDASVSSSTYMTLNESKLIIRDIPSVITPKTHQPIANNGLPTYSHRPQTYKSSICPELINHHNFV